VCRFRILRAFLHGRSALEQILVILQIQSYTEFAESAGSTERRNGALRSDCIDQEHARVNGLGME
jgi:hypothetical protein